MPFQQISFQRKSRPWIWSRSKLKGCNLRIRGNPILSLLLWCKQLTATNIHGLPLRDGTEVPLAAATAAQDVKWTWNSTARRKGDSPHWQGKCIMWFNALQPPHSRVWAQATDSCHKPESSFPSMTSSSFFLLQSVLTIVLFLLHISLQTVQECF